MGRFLLVFNLLFAILGTTVYARQPTDALKDPIDRVVMILRDPQYRSEGGRELQRKKIWEIIQGVFDFDEMAKRTLSRNWRRFTGSERKEFTELFAEFLGNNYIDKIQSGYEEEKILYVDQKMMGQGKAVVRTKILRENLEIPVSYSLLLQSGVWKVYDVNIEGVSLVRNYRTQFNKALMRKSPGQLIEILKTKIERQKRKREEARKQTLDPLAYGELKAGLCGILIRG